MNTQELHSTKMYIYDFSSNLADDAQQTHPFWLDIFDTPVLFSIAALLLIVTLIVMVRASSIENNNETNSHHRTILQKIARVLIIISGCVFFVAAAGYTAAYIYDHNSTKRQDYIQSRMTEALPAVDGYMTMNFTNRDILCADDKPENHNTIFCGGTEVRPVQYFFGNDSGTLTPFIDTNPDTGNTSLGIDNKIDGVDYKR